MKVNNHIKRQAQEFNQLSEDEKEDYFVHYIVDIATEIASINNLYPDDPEEFLSDENRDKAYSKAYELIDID